MLTLATARPFLSIFAIDCIPAFTFPKSHRVGMLLWKEQSSFYGRQIFAGMTTRAT